MASPIVNEFRDSFKYYKSRNPPPDLKDVIDFDNPDPSKVTLKPLLECESLNEQGRHILGVKPIEDWETYEFLDIPGLIYIKNPFTTNGQKYWIIKCLKDFSGKPHKTNLDAHNLLDAKENLWNVCFASNRAKELLPKLRWATLGYHHNWDTKIYSETSKTPMPLVLALLSQIIAKALNFMDFTAEAAIINYYRMNSTLAGHTDHSEIDLTAPLFSISFGQSAIFLIGGFKQDDAATSMIVKSGDIIVMSGKSRLRYHGVPKILPANILPWDHEKATYNEKQTYYREVDWNIAKEYISQARINMSVRQVLKQKQTSL